MTSPFAPILGSLVKQRGVLGSMIVSESDGIIIDSQLQLGVRGNVVAALTASLYRKARLSSAAAGFGDAGFLQLEAEEGRVCAIGRDDLLLVTMAEARANVGLIRVEMLRALEAIR